MTNPCPDPCFTCYQAGILDTVRQNALTVGDIRKQAYRDGYNDAMRVQAEVEWLYGPRRPVANPKRVGNMNTPADQTTALDGPTGTE